MDRKYSTMDVQNSKLILPIQSIFIFQKANIGLPQQGCGHSVKGIIMDLTLAPNRIDQPFGNTWVWNDTSNP